jgi:hypothetical protein
MKKTLLVLIICILAISCSVCSGRTTSTPASTSAGSPVPTDPQASSNRPKANPAPVATPMARPPAGKSQELKFGLQASADTYSLVVFLEQAETLDIDWKFVSSPQVGIGFMFTTPEGREMDSKLQPLNLPDHPLYDSNLPSQKIQEIVGSHVVINVGRDKYCGEGYYSLVFSGNPSQSGMVYLRYSLEKTPEE